MVFLSQRTKRRVMAGFFVLGNIAPFFFSQTKTGWPIEISELL